MGRNISPPARKKRKVSEDRTETAAVPCSPPRKPASDSTMRIFSWNVNGITPFLQRHITTFFQAGSAPSRATAGLNTATSRTSAAPTPPASLRAFLHRHHYPAMLFLQEVKISDSDTKTQNAVRTAVNARLRHESAQSPSYTAHFVLPRDPHNARGPRGSGKVYGVCSIVREDLSSRYAVDTRTVPWDSEGRVSVVELRPHPHPHPHPHPNRSSTNTGLASPRQSNPRPTPCPMKSCAPKLALFNIYAVNGTTNPYRDPTTGSVTGTRHDRKLAFHRLLSQECTALEAEGWHVLVAGDMNVAPDERDGHPRLRTFPGQHCLNRADFRARFLGGRGLGRPSSPAGRNADVDGAEGAGDGCEVKCFHGVDVWRAMHGDERRYTYYSRNREWGTSCDRVDYVVVGRKTWDEGLVTGAGILDSEAERGPSDHVPVWVDVELGRGRDEDEPP